MLTPEIQKQVAKIIVDSFKNGWDPAERLERAGLLLHPASKVAAVSVALRDIAELIESTPAHHIVPAGVPLSAGDIVRHVGDFLRNIADSNEALLKGK